MSRGADAVQRSPARDLEHGSGVGPASLQVSSRDWPLTSYLELGALPTAVPCARLHAKLLLGEWGLEELEYAVELVVSEFVTNAQRISRGINGSRYGGRWIPGVPPVRLWLCSDKQRVLVQVWDGADHLPEPQGADLEAESGRGLLLVETLSTEWGTLPLEGASGKLVWAVCTP